MMITAKMVSELREKTGAGMMDCKKALTAANGDIDAAIENLRKSGIAKAEKKAGRRALYRLQQLRVGRWRMRWVCDLKKSLSFLRTATSVSAAYVAAAKIF